MRKTFINKIVRSYDMAAPNIPYTGIKKQDKNSIRMNETAALNRATFGLPLIIKILPAKPPAALNISPQTMIIKIVDPMTNSFPNMLNN